MVMMNLHCFCANPLARGWVMVTRRKSAPQLVQPRVPLPIGPATARTPPTPRPVHAATTAALPWGPPFRSRQSPKGCNAAAHQLQGRRPAFIPYVPLTFAGIDTFSRHCHVANDQSVLNGCVHLSTETHSHSPGVKSSSDESAKANSASNCATL